jgi:hypothetical protein
MLTARDCEPEANANVSRIALFRHGDLSGQQLPIRNFFERSCRDSFGLLPEFLQAFQAATEGLGFAGMGLALPRLRIQRPNDTRTISVALLRACSSVSTASYFGSRIISPVSTSRPIWVAFWRQRSPSMRWPMSLTTSDHNSRQANLAGPCGGAECEPNYRSDGMDKRQTLTISPFLWSAGTPLFYSVI